MAALSLTAQALAWHLAVLQRLSNKLQHLVSDRVIWSVFFIFLFEFPILRFGGLPSARCEIMMGRRWEKSQNSTYQSPCLNL